MKQKIFKTIKEHVLLGTVSTIVILGGLIGLYGYYQVLNQAFPKVLVHLDKGDGTFGETIEFENTERIINLDLKPNQADAATRRVGIISVRTTEDAPLPLADIQKVLFDGPQSVKAFYNEASYGKLILTPGQNISLNSALTIDKSKCGDVKNYLLTTWTRSIVTAAQNQGYNFSQNENTIIVFPFKCSAALGVGLMPGSKLYVYGPDALALGVIGHEFGHNLGMGHSAKVDCRAGKLPPDCTLVSGDNLSIMGGGTKNQPNNIHKAKAGWVTHQRVSTAGTYSLNPIEMDSQNSITVPASGGGGFYYLEYRKATGFDTNLANSPATKGISIRTSVPMDPAVDTQLLTILAKDQIYTDPNGRTKIKTCDAGGAFAKVGVTFDGTVPNCQGGTTPPGGGTGGTGGGGTSCTETNPGLVITPSSQSTSPGGKLTYTVKVTNNACSSASFTLSSNKPGNAWTSTFSQASITNLAKGSVKEVTLNITSPNNTPTSSYPINVTVAKNGSTQFKRTSTITFQVAKVSVTSFKANGVSPTLTINKGSNVTLTWVCGASASARIKNADGTALANNTNFNPSGSFVVGHAIQTNKTYTVECFEKASFKGNVATKSVSVNVR